MEQQIAVFCETDDFCKAYEEYCQHSLLMTIALPRNSTYY